MKLTISKEEGNKLQFDLSEVSTSFANAVRRYAMNAVPVLAMDEVTFYDNTSALFDEYLAHRIGLIPLVTPSGVPKDAEIEFYLDATGPKIVYSGDLETKDKEVKPAREKIPIVTLTANQQIRLEAKARLGIARQHAKYQGGLAGYEIADGTYKFVVESCYQMSPRELLIRAADVLDADLDDLENQLEKAKKKK